MFQDILTKKIEERKRIQCVQYRSRRRRRRL